MNAIFVTKDLSNLVQMTGEAGSMKRVYSQAVRSDNDAIADMALGYMKEKGMLDAVTLIGIHCEAKSQHIREEAYRSLNCVLLIHGRACLAPVDTASIMMALADKAERRPDAVRLAGLLSQA